MKFKNTTRIFLFLLSFSTSFVPLNGAHIDTTHSTSDNSMPPLIEEGDKQVVLYPLESQNNPEVDTQKLYKALDRSYMKPLTQKVKHNFGIALGNDCLTQIAHNLQPLIDFFTIYEHSPSKVQHSHDERGKPLKPLYDFKEILKKIKKCKDNSDRLYTFSLILLGLPSHLVKNKNLIFLTERLKKHCGMDVYDRATLEHNFSKDAAEAMYLKELCYENNIDYIIDGLKCQWKVKLEKMCKTNLSIITKMAVSPDDGSLLWFENHSKVYLWDIKKKEPVLCQGNEKNIIQLAWSSDGKFFFSTYYVGGAIGLWNKERRSLLTMMKVSEGLLTAMCPSEHGLFVGDHKGNLYVVKNFEKVYKVETLVSNSSAKRSAIRNIVSLPNNCILFSKGECAICIYDECTKKLIYTLDKRIKIHTIKASPNGK
ncbi:MAG: WD40 repeat domain-containing protein, partial [Bacteroidota bacterium]